MYKKYIHVYSIYMYILFLVMSFLWCVVVYTSIYRYHPCSYMAQPDIPLYLFHNLTKPMYKNCLLTRQYIQPCHNMSRCVACWEIFNQKCKNMHILVHTSKNWIHGRMNLFMGKFVWGVQQAKEFWLSNGQLWHCCKDGRHGSMACQVNLWLRQFGHGKPLLGSLCQWSRLLWGRRLLCRSKPWPLLGWDLLLQQGW